MTTYYKILRSFRDQEVSPMERRGLTLEQAQAHCKDPETSSSTCTSPEALRRTEMHGPWFDSYEEE